jgi:peptide/nickel transport system substrate-binding protein
VTAAPRHRRTIILLVAALALAAALVVAAVAAAGSPSPSPGSPSPAAGTVKYRVGILVEPDNLNPFIGYMFSSYEIWYLTYAPLVGYDYGPLTPVKGPQSSGLATDWSTSPNGKTWTFTIRSGATWSDGVPVTARDVAFTYNYIIRNNLTNWTTYTQNIVRAVATDDHTVKIYCSRPKADMLSVYVPIVPQHVWSNVPGKAAGLSYANNPPIVGCGPFTCTEFKKGSYVKMVANPHYWLGRPAIDELYFEYYTNADTMVEDLKSGALDGATQLLDAEYRELQKQPGIEARTIRSNGFDELAFNCYDGSQSRGNPVLRDVRFRQALNYAIDTRRICAIA